jgi:ParB-like chromosome segregation protein Spo0J
MTTTRTLSIAYRPLEQLIPYARNSRTHSDAQIAQLSASVSEWGFTNPVLIDEHGGIIAGHGRVLAARKLGMTEVPTIVLAGLSEAQKAAYVIADNKLAMNAGWDVEMLAAEFGRLGELGYDATLTGFNENEVQKFLESWSPTGEVEGASAIDPDGYALAHKCPKCGFEFDDKP